MILPGNATERVYLRAPAAVGAALGFEVSILDLPLISECFRYSVSVDTIEPCLLCDFAHPAEKQQLLVSKSPVEEVSDLIDFSFDEKKFKLW
jgi:hypothetical protein